MVTRPEQRVSSRAVRAGVPFRFPHTLEQCDPYRYPKTETVEQATGATTARVVVVVVLHSPFW